MFDLDLDGASRERFTVDLPASDQPACDDSRTDVPAMWSIGAIVGPSGSGKTTVARQAYQLGGLATGAMASRHDWPEHRAIVDGFPDDVDGRTVTATLSAVGLASPPAWVRPYRALSNGEQFRCDLAYAILSDSPLVVFDEFTSVVDRQVAKFASAAIARAVRRGRTRCRQFVAVTCHYDVLPWLEPDWWLDMATGKLDGRWVQPRNASEWPSRPPITIEVQRCGRERWQAFRRHHYLSTRLTTSARCYIARWDGTDVAFCATMPLFGQVGMRAIHRLVVLPDFQGMGLGAVLLNAVARHEADRSRISLVSSHPALIRAVARHPDWRCVRVTQCGVPHSCTTHDGHVMRGSAGRATASLRYLPGERHAIASRRRVGVGATCDA